MEEKIETLSEENSENVQDVPNDEGPKVYKIALSKLITVAKQYITGKITDEEFEDFVDKMYIRLYIPLQEKMGLIMSLLTQYTYNSTIVQEIKITELYRNLFFFVLLGAYGGIDCSNIALVNYENYDLLYPIFNPVLMELCGEDYLVIKEMFKDSLNLYNVQNFNDILKSVDSDTLKSDTIQLQEALKELNNNADLIKDLKDIAAVNNPVLSEIVNNIA